METQRNMKFCYFALFVLFVHLEYLSAISLNPVTVAAKKAVVSQNPADYLSFDYYLNTCPDAEGIIQQKVGAWIKKDPTLAPSIIRLHFHDCAVRVSRDWIKLNSLVKLNPSLAFLFFVFEVISWQSTYIETEEINHVES